MAKTRVGVMGYWGILGILGTIGWVSGLGTAQASTQAFYQGETKAVLAVQSPAQSTDLDAETLYDLMAVAPSQSPFGPAKKLEADQGHFKLVCGEKQGYGFTCTLPIQDSPHARISPLAGTIEFLLEGEEAWALYRQFVPNNPDSVDYHSLDGRLEIHADPTRFVLTYRG